jgi:DNA-binding beta-propeller fold protein YncE
MARRQGIPATQAQLNGPRNVAVDAAGNIYVADSLNNRVRKVDSQTGLISTAVGTGMVGFSVDGGTAASALICVPRYVNLDKAGDLYVDDDGNSRIRKVSLV